MNLCELPLVVISIGKLYSYNIVYIIIIIINLFIILPYFDSYVIILCYD